MNAAKSVSILPAEPLAIVGMACRLPGANDLSSFWELLVNGQSGIDKIPPDRMNQDLYYSQIPGKQSKSYSAISGLIPTCPGDPSSDFRSIDVQSVQWDPSHEILCGVVEQARVNAGWSLETLSRPRTGVYVGHSSGSPLAGELVLGSLIPEVAQQLEGVAELQDLSASDRHAILADLVTRIQHQRPVRHDDGPKLEASFVAQLIARRFELDGPQMAVDAACASSLMALALASAALTQREIDQAVVAGASYCKSDSLVLFSQARSCSATASRPFDADADGLVNSEGYAVILLKTLKRALNDGDNVHAVIRGIGLSSDGRGRSLWVPRKDGQLEAIRRAYGGDVSPDSVQYLEAHATSTQVGDATELEALSEFFHNPTRNRKIPLGSVKSNIGHTLESAGLASLIKSVLCMQKGIVPPTINLATLNPAINWEDNPFLPLKSSVPWPDVENQPRRAAINAFGIGGLNAHVVVDGPICQEQVEVGLQKHGIEKSNGSLDTTRYQVAPSDSQSIAVIGRGVVVAGAFNLDMFRSLLKTNESQLRPPPADRWMDTPFSGTRPAICEAFKQAKGGYVSGYTYDWRKHHIPPLQIENANPLQFMLLDAAQQALEESGYERREFDRSRTAVLVGTLFGGEFSHQLQIGLRLPEIIDELTKSLKDRKWNDEQILKTCSAVESHLLKIYPAINDQTGSFTCSTQASRVAKTLNLMGGAMAIDAGDCSSLAALQAAQHLLASKVVDFVFCAAAQRDLDAAGFEAWNYREFDTPESGTMETMAPGEGAVVLFLRRLDDARRDNDRIHGVVHGVHAMSRKNRSTIPSTEMASQGSGLDLSKLAIRSPNASSLTRQFGHLQAASGVFEVLAGTVENQLDHKSSNQYVVQTTTIDGEYQAVCEFIQSEIRADDIAVKVAVEQPIKSNLSNELGGRFSEVAATRKMSTPKAGQSPGKIQANNEKESHIIRLWGVDESELKHRIAALMSIEGFQTSDRVNCIPEHAPFRLTMTCSIQNRREKLQSALSAVAAGQSSVRLQEQGIYYCLPSDAGPPKLAALFPGQGSHRSGMLADVIKSSTDATNMLRRADQSLIRHGANRCYEWMIDEEALPADDLQAVQVAMIVADVCAHTAACEWGLRPDFLLGHSFGEYAALVAAGTLDLESALAITIARSIAVGACRDSAGAMLSISAPAKVIRPLVSSRKDLFLSHINAPGQTIVAGTRAAVEDFASKAKSLGFAAVEIPVSSPFHTPLLAQARPALQIALGQHRWRPPRIPLLSSVSGRFVANKEEIQENLSRQLIEPLNWVNCIERLLAEDVRVFVETGPGRVLTKLTQQIIADRNAFVISMEDLSLTVAERRQRIVAAMEAAGIRSNLPPIIQEPMAVDLSETFVTEIQKNSFRGAKPIIESHSPADDYISSTVSDQDFACLNETSIQELENEDPLSQLLIDVIVSQTGYPRDIIEKEWELEADLGIDSIRKMQILGELREYFDPTEATESLRFDEIRTVNDLLSLLRKTSGKKDWLEVKECKLGGLSEVSCDRPATAAGSGCTALNQEVINDHCRDEAPHSAVDDFLIDFIVEKTKYPRDVIEIDADLESDLGIDSIAKAQLLGEVRSHFQLVMPQNSDRALFSEIRTLRQIREMIESAGGDGSQTAEITEQDSIVVSKVTNGHSVLDLDLGTTIVESAPSVRRHNTIDGVKARPISEPSENSKQRQGLPTSTMFSFERGKNWGRIHRRELQHQLFDLADRNVAICPRAEDLRWESLDFHEESQLRGVADGADILPDNLLLIRDILRLPLPEEVQTEDRDRHSTTGNDVEDDLDPALIQPIESNRASITQRYRLEMSRPVEKRWFGKKPEFSGGAIVVGDNLDCSELTRRLESFGVPVSRLAVLGTREELVAQIDSIWRLQPSPHLFILTPRDPQANSTLDEAEWKLRRGPGVSSLFWLCQKWLNLVEQSNLLDDASLIGITSLGGDFGTVREIHSAESGALAGLLKAITIECWMNGHRTIPIKVLDLPIESKPEEISDAICVELTEPTYDNEIGWNDGLRSVLRCVPEPISDHSPQKLIPTGHWIVTGGARGITAFIVGQIARHFRDVHFHLVGQARLPALSDEDRRLAESDLVALREKVIRNAKRSGQSGISLWKEMEKAIEIDRSLIGFQAAGIPVTYHSCDVADRSQLSELLNAIRQECGSVDGVIHGAGIGKDASFQRKDPQIVEKCLAAKIDGSLNLMSLTCNDPLQAFIAFGSISGRFGANGHTDYSMANEMLAKLVRWHRQLRPTIPAAVFHWHAWDDIGMATKPETRLALKAIGLQLMPANEGAEHFLREIIAGLPLPEVLITDTRYYRMFYPADRLIADVSNADKVSPTAMQRPLIERTSSGADGSVICRTTLNPVHDPFLAEHTLNHRPLLPMVIMAELLAEGAYSVGNGRRPSGIRDFEICASVKFPTDSPFEMQIISSPAVNETAAVELRADFRSRSGRLIDANRLYVKGMVQFDVLQAQFPDEENFDRDPLKKLNWQKPQYPNVGSAFYIGAPLRCLTKYAVDRDNGRAWGRISAPSLCELAGPERDISTWFTPSAVFDATLFLSGLLAWNCIRPGIALPRKFKQARFLRSLRPAEVCWVRSQIVDSDPTSASFDIAVWDCDGQPVMVIEEYVATWLPS